MRTWKGRVAYAISLVLVFLGALKLFDHFLLEGRSIVFGGHFDRTEQRNVAQKEIYPYTGGHTRADLQLSPQLRAGDHGFMIDFDLDRPPEKKPGEFRLIVTGGSGAAGWGATANSRMMHSVLERLFAERKPCNAVTRLRVINLAMGDSMSYQNYIALNRWGHALAPDMIMSYAGFNDINVPYYTRSDGYRDFQVVQAFATAARHSSSPGWLIHLGRLYPGLFKETAVGLSIRSFFMPRLARESLREYHSRFPAVETTDQVIDSLVKPMYVHALKSMKRDFAGIPMVVAFQPYVVTAELPVFKDFLAAENTAVGAFSKTWRLDFGEGIERFLAVYSYVRQHVRASLGGYVNDEWLFLDVHDIYSSQLADRFPRHDGIHLGDDAQAAIAEVIAEKVFPMVCKTALKKGAHDAGSRS